MSELPDNVIDAEARFRKKTLDADYEQSTNTTLRKDLGQRAVISLPGSSPVNEVLIMKPEDYDELVKSYLQPNE